RPTPRSRLSFAHRDSGHVPARSSGGAGMVLWKRQPLGHQLAAVGLEPLVEQLRAEDAVDPKIAKVSAQLAPRTEEGHVDVIRHCDRPYRSLRAAAFFVDIGD